MFLTEYMALYAENGKKCVIGRTVLETIFLTLIKILFKTCFGFPNKKRHIIEIKTLNSLTKSQ